MVTFEQELEMKTWKTVDDIFASSIDPVANYKEIITGIFLNRDLIEPFIRRTIENGNGELVANNVGSLSMYKNWDVAKQNPEYKKILFDNFEKALSGNNEIEPEVLKGIAQENVKLIDDNWLTLFGMTNKYAVARKELIGILKSSENGKEVVDQNFSQLFYGGYSYGSFMAYLMKENIIGPERIAEEILKNPTKIVEGELASYGSSYDLVEFLNITERLLTSIPSLDQDKVQEAHASIEESLVQNFDRVMEKAERKQYDKDYNPLPSKYSVGVFQATQDFFRDKDKINEKLVENYETLSSQIEQKETMDLMHLYSETGVDMSNISIEDIMAQTFSEIKDPNLQWAISKIAGELLQDQSLTPDKMQIYGSGHYSRTIKVGNYVFKVGEPRSTTTIKNDERLIQPLIRREMQGENGEKIFLEVQDLVDKDWYVGLSDQQVEDELYKVYSSMRDRGIRWTDARKENVGRLLKSNTGKFNVNGQELEGADTAKGYEGENVTALPAGELVVIDTDYIFPSDQEKFFSSNFSIHKKLEARYLEELQKNNGVKGDTELLNSAIETSKRTITDEDIKTMVQIVASRTNDRSKTNEEKEQTDEERE